MSGKSDQDLLARLNALKASPIDLERTPESQAMPTTDDGDDIARRFLGLRPSNAPTSGEKASTGDADDLEEVEDIGDMLKELRSQQKKSLAPGDDKRVQILLAQAQSALDLPEDTTEGDQDGGGARERVPPDVDADEHSEEASIDEDAEAADLLAEILAEVQLNGNEAEGEATPLAREEVEDEAGAFDESLFPTTPAKEPELAPVPADDPLQLPSAPTTAPTKPKSKTTKTTKKKFTDAEIETWCEICQADAEVRCLGCDGELYCMRCWKEGHTGPDVGYEERTHRCVQYSKPGPEAAAA